MPNDGLTPTRSAEASPLKVSRELNEDFIVEYRVKAPIQQSHPGR